MPPKGRTRRGTTRKLTAPASILADRTGISDQGKNTDTNVKHISQEVIVEDQEVVEVTEVEDAEGIENEIKEPEGETGAEGKIGAEVEIEGIVEEGREEVSKEWKNPDMKQSTEEGHVPGEEGDLGNEELVAEGADGDDDGDISWVEELWNKKKAEEAKPKSAHTEEEEDEEIGEHLVFEMKKIEKTKTNSKGALKTTEEERDTEEKKAAAMPVQKRGEGFPDSLLEFTKRSSCIPPAYFGPAFDESCFQCCIRICPVVYSDLVRKDFASVLARADCVRMSLGSKSTPRLLEIYCQRSAPLLYNLMFCPYSNNTVTVELVRKKPTGWKTVTLKDRVFKVPSVYSSDECTKAKFQLKSAFFRHNLGKIISVNTRQHVKERSLFISNIPGTVDRSLVKQIFPLAGKISWVNASENLRSAVLTMKSRKMVLDHIAAMREITINGHELKIGAVGLNQEDAEKLLEEHIKKHHVQGWNSVPSKTEKKKDFMETGEDGASSETVNVKTDNASSSKKAKPGLLGESPMKAKGGTGEDQKASPEEFKNGEWEKKEREREIRFREVTEKERLEREKRDQEQRENLQREQGREWQRVQKLERERASQCGAEEAIGANMRKREPSQDESSRPQGGEGKPEEHSDRQRVRRCPPGGNPLHQERHEREMEIQQEMALQREMELKREMEMQREMKMQRDVELQQERELQRERKMIRERKREMEREWHDKEQWEWEEMERRKLEQVRQEEEQRHKEEMLREKERMERMHQDAMHKLRHMEEQQRRERKELKRREQEMEAERARMQQQLEEERLHQQQERQEWEHASSRKRSRFEESEDREHKMAGSKKGSRDEGLWGNFFIPVGSDMPEGPSSSTTGPSNVQLEASVKRKLELEVARQAEELKKSLALLDKIQKDPSGISSTMSEIRGSTEKGHGGHHPGPSTVFDRTKQQDYQQGYSQDSQPPYQQLMYGSSQNYSVHFQGGVEDASYFKCSHKGDGQMSISEGDYNSQYYGTQVPDDQQSNPPPRGTEYWTGQGDYDQPQRQQEGRGDSYNNQADSVPKQYRGGAGHYGQWGGFGLGGAQRRESGRVYQQQWGRPQGRDSTQDGREGKDGSYDQIGRHGENDQATRPRQGGDCGGNYDQGRQGQQRGRSFGQRKDR